MRGGLQSVPEDGREEGLPATLWTLDANDEGWDRADGKSLFLVLRAVCSQLGKDMRARVSYGLRRGRWWGCSLRLQWVKCKLMSVERRYTDILSLC